MKTNMKTTFSLSSALFVIALFVLGSAQAKDLRCLVRSAPHASLRTIILTNADQMKNGTVAEVALDDLDARFDSMKVLSNGYTQIFLTNGCDNGFELNLRTEQLDLVLQDKKMNVRGVLNYGMVNPSDEALDNDNENDDRIEGQATVICHSVN